MDMKCFIMVLVGVFEFDFQYNKDVISRLMDNILILQLIREIGSINLKKNEFLFICLYSLKVRVFLLFYFVRMKIFEIFEEDQ